jgi:hypothetical protein
MHNERLDENQIVLSCWKEIAHYLGKGVRTVQRWEQDWDLPVRRPNGSTVKGPVAARTADLDRWISVHWSERDGRGKHRAAPTGTSLSNEPARPAPSLPDGAPLIQVSRELRTQNRALMADLGKTLEALRCICTNLELQIAQDRVQQLTPTALQEPMFNLLESESGDAQCPGVPMSQLKTA